MAARAVNLAVEDFVEQLNAEIVAYTSAERGPGRYELKCTSSDVEWNVQRAINAFQALESKRASTFGDLVPQPLLQHIDVQAVEGTEGGAQRLDAVLSAALGDRLLGGTATQAILEFLDVPDVWRRECLRRQQEEQAHGGAPKSGVEAAAPVVRSPLPGRRHHSPGLDAIALLRRQCASTPRLAELLNVAEAALEQSWEEVLNTRQVRQERRCGIELTKDVSLPYHREADPEQLLLARVRYEERKAPRKASNAIPLQDRITQIKQNPLLNDRVDALMPGPSGSKHSDLDLRGALAAARRKGK